jgi:hypothetical protein
VTGSVIVSKQIGHVALSGVRLGFRVALVVIFEDMLRLIFGFSILDYY